MTERLPVKQDAAGNAGVHTTGVMTPMTTTTVRRTTASTTTRSAGSGRRPGMSKATLGKAKLAAVALAAVAFIGSLFGVIRATPNFVTPGQAPSPSAPQGGLQSGLPAFTAPSQVSQFAPLPQAPSFAMPQAPQAPAFRPLVRSRGS